MMFILRAIFWLAVVSAFLPTRQDEPGLGEQAGRMVGAAMDYCAKNPGECVGTAKATADAIRIPADFILRAAQENQERAQGNMATAPVRPHSNQPVPQPKPRPASF